MEEKKAESKKEANENAKDEVAVKEAEKPAEETPKVARKTESPEKEEAKAPEPAKKEEKSAKKVAKPKKPKKKTEEDEVFEESAEGEDKTEEKIKEVKKLKDEESIEAWSAREDIVDWKPRTELGKRVKSGELRTMHDVIHVSSPIKEVAIVDIMLPEMDEEIIDVGRVQRTTDSGRRTNFRVVSAVGNGNGYVGVGIAKGKEAGPTIRKSIERAKLNIKEIKRGCGSWECGCGNPHTVPFKVSGKHGSAKVIIKPAPRGVGLVSGQIARKIIALAGITDAWIRTEGHTRTSLNFAFAILKALENTNYIKISDEDTEKLKIVSGSV